MSTFRKIAKATIGSVLGKDAVEGLYDFENSLSASLSSQYRESRARLEGFKDKHSGERCFIIGNGPSLKEMDLSALKDETTFGLNRIYLAFEEWGFTTTYHVATNKYVVEQCREDIKNISMPRFTRWEFRDEFKSTPGIVFLRSRNKPGFYEDIARDGLWEGATVTYVAMQLAFYMGFSEIVLIGVDHNFKSKGEPHKVVVSEGDDPDHFDPSYFGKGFKWQLPDLETSEVAYHMAREAYENAGRSIVDATVGGKLQVFPKANFIELIKR
jgi:hypothetical protein